MNGGSSGSAVERGVVAAEGHRDVLQRLRNVVQLLITKVEGILDGKEPSVLVPVKVGRGEAGSEKVAFDVLGDRDSVADTVVKLAGILTKLIPLERQAFYLEGGIDPKDLTDEQILRLLGRNPGSRGEL